MAPTHSDGLSTVDLDKEVEHSVRIAKIALTTNGAVIERSPSN